jgi:ubiquinone/menaquinone biosynthesis C-methylase UbiE
MQTNSSWESFFPNNLLENAYQTWQQAKATLSLAHKNFSSEIRKIFFPLNQLNFKQVSPESWSILRARFTQLMTEDWQDAQQGIYPLNLLFEVDWQEFIKAYFSLWLDYPSSWSKMQAQSYQDFPAHINLEKYPQYYRRNFHYQTDGYLSDYSANIYDLQVDILFNGVADSMRRRILKPLKQGLSKFEADEAVRILDVACGTGRTLTFLRASLPSASLYGIDLSSAYLRKASQLLSQLPSELPQLIEGNAENLPYQDNYFQGVTNVFLLHELPNPVRQQVIHEFFRVLQPRGTLVICDSMQLSDSAELEAMMINFVTMFHEPFYWDYIKDNIAEKLDQAGFINIKTSNHAFSKCWVATKPV